ncbi:urokinase plasminogen activator surface receptor-like [Mugil cephalus]|uniref:urokinase plasminogen activator surface receptor-like n=1 Tax=Mugil cephalus TaxID=48193 RepID=UPI001FB5E9FB|nr:urokinase plasminogen activator surface receptor-like [Mugil cephalus]
MYLFTLVLGIVLLPEASTLRCYECKPGLDGTCSEATTQCPSPANQCAAVRVTSYSGGSAPANVNAKSCAVSEECVEHSINFGDSRTVVTSKCCNTDLCNTQPAPEPSTLNPNGKKCVTCDGENCNTILNCQGNEDYCISATVNAGGEKITMKGCVSRTLCLNTKSTLVPALLQAEISCCQGNNCNSASSTSAGLMLLVAPLISLVLS